VNSNLWSLAWRSIRSRRVRFYVPSLGVLIGVSAIIALIPIATGLEKAVLAQFRDTGYNVVLLTLRRDASGAATSIGGQENASELASAQATALDPVRILPGVAGVKEFGQIGTTVLRVVSADVSGHIRVTAPSQGLVQGFSGVLGGFEISEGRGLDPEAADEVVLGAGVAAIRRLRVGQSITIGGTPFTVVGILVPSRGSRGAAASAGDSGHGMEAFPGRVEGIGQEIINGLVNTDDAVFVPFEQAQELLRREVETLLAVRVESGVSVSSTIARIEIALAEHGASMTVASVHALADDIQKTLGMVRVTRACIAMAALVIGAVGTMYMMYASVLGHTRKIGILKAIGAESCQILALFLIESGLMGLIGGVLGLSIGVGLSFLGTSVASDLIGAPYFSPVFDPGLIVCTVGFVLLLGTLAGSLAGRGMPRDSIRSRR
jgi:putative ABC transport system permease protein